MAAAVAAIIICWVLGKILKRFETLFFATGTIIAVNLAMYAISGHIEHMIFATGTYLFVALFGTYLHKKFMERRTRNASRSSNSA